jgi:L-ascorbate metabolism protein UlaG (beta-lactamase superfamily)
LAPTPNDGAFLSQADNAAVAIGHSTFALKLGNQFIVTDPFFQTRALLVARRAPAALPADIFPPQSVVLISHNHYDHLDDQAVKVLARRQAIFICPLGLKQFLQNAGARNIHELDWWGRLSLLGFNFTCLPAQHWSRRFRQRQNAALWSSWLIDGGGRRIFFGGDSGYFVGFAEFGRCFAGIDLALLPAGACLPRWMMAYSHLNVEEMFKAFHDLKAKRLIPMHWGSIKLGDDPIAWPLAQIERYLRQNPEMRARVEILRPGQQMVL